MAKSVIGLSDADLKVDGDAEISGNLSVGGVVYATPPYQRIVASSIRGYACSSSGVKTSRLPISGSGDFAYPDSASQFTLAEYLVYLCAGTYTFTITHHNQPNMGIVGFWIDKDELGTMVSVGDDFDCYGDYKNVNHEKSYSDVEISISGKHTIQFRVDNKNALSAGYALTLQVFEISKTA